MRIIKLVIEIISFLLVFVFVYAAVSKLLNIHLFISQMRFSPWIKDFNNFLAYVIPIFELIVAGLIMIPGLRKIGLYLFACSLSIFTVYIIAVLNSGLHIPCSCGGLIQHLSWPQHIAFNIILMILSFVALWLEPKQSSKSNFEGEHVSYS